MQSLAQRVIQVGISIAELRDEIYAQVIKQITNNPRMYLIPTALSPPVCHDLMLFVIQGEHIQGFPVLTVNSWDFPSI